MRIATGSFGVLVSILFAACSPANNTQMDGGNTDVATDRGTTMDTATDSPVTPPADARTDTPAMMGACGDNTTCATCSPIDGCGWCSNTHQCVAGTQMGPDDNSCTMMQWAWVPNQCPGAPPPNCAPNMTCEACGPVNGCGWCRRTNSCVPGARAGSTDGMCMGADWAYVTGDCAGPGDGGAPDANRPDAAPPVDAGATDAAVDAPRG